MKTSTVTIFVILPFLTSSRITQADLPEFLDLPSSVTAKSGSRVRLKCAGSTLDSTVTWYYNGMQISEDDFSNGGRRKRAKDLNDVMTSRYLSSRGRESRKFYNNRKRRKRTRTNRAKRSLNQNNFIDANTRYLSMKPFRRKRGVDRNKRSASVSPDFLRGVNIRDGRLIIPRLTNKYVGEYHCVVSNNVGKIRSPVAIVEIAEIDDFDEDLIQESVQANIGNSVVIPCQPPHSIPEAMSQWKVDRGDWVQSSTDSFTILPTGDLLIHNVSDTTGGHFQCAVYNEMLRERKESPFTTELVLTESPSSQQQLIFPTSGFTNNITVEAGKDITLPCAVSHGVPAQWSIASGSSLPDNSKIEIAGLLLSDLKNTDSGTYKCTVAEKVVVYHLNVEKSPSVVASSQTMYATEEHLKSTHSMICSDRNNEGGNVDWEWFKDGRKVQTNEDGVAVEGNKLTLSPVVTTSTGVYQCMASTQYGSDFQSFYVECKDTISASPPTNTNGGTNEGIESVSYFDAPLDENGLDAPIVTSKLRTNDPNSYLLSWKLPDGAERVETIAIRCAKSNTHGGGETQPAYKWATQSVPATQTSYVLKDLEASSLYQLELVSVSENGKTSQIVTTSFRTGEMVENYSPDDSSNVETPKKNDRPQGELPEPPTKPETPSVTPISATSVSLMWIPRSNGGSPIEGYRVQVKEVDNNGKRNWYTIRDGLAAGKHSCEINQLERDVKYRFRVIAYNSGGNSKPSSASEVFPKTKLVLRLKNPPQILNRNINSYNTVTLHWTYDDPVASTVEGYNIHYRPSDKDSERDYELLPINSPIATSGTIKNLLQGMQYDIKITAYNSRGMSPPSTVVTVDLPPVHIADPPYQGDDYINADEPSYNDDALQRVKQKDIIYLITGGVLGIIVIILVLSVFCYWRQKAKWNETKTTTSNTSVKYTSGHDVNITKFGAGSGQHTPNDTKCTCSQHHSGQSSLERVGSHYHGKHSAYQYAMTSEHYSDTSQTAPNCPHLHNNPLNMYMEYGYQPYMARIPYSNYPPNWIVRNGNFCHIIPGDSRKINSEQMESGGNGFAGGGAMVMRRYNGNVGTGVQDANTPNDHEYNYMYDSHDRRDGAKKQNFDTNSDETVTSGIATQSDVTASRLSQEINASPAPSCEKENEDEALLEKCEASSGCADSAQEDCVDDENEKTTFLKSNENPRKYCKETSIS